MAAKRFTERFAFSLDSGSRVNREAGTISGVRICGETSVNGRRYPVAVLRRDFKKYEGAKVNYDHSRQGERSVRDAAGWLSDVAPGSDGIPRGTLHLLTTDPTAAKVLEAAEKNPNQLGLSHVANCKFRYEGGVEVIESIESVDSVDIVTQPATNKGFFESGAKTVSKIKLREWSNKYGHKLGSKKWARFEALLEMDETFGDVEMDAPADDAPADDGVEAAMQTLAAAVLKSALAGDLSAEEAGAKITAFIQTHKGETPAPAEDDDGEGESEESAKKPAKKPRPKKEAALTAADVSRIVAEQLKGFKPVQDAEKPKSGAKAETKKESAEKQSPDDAKSHAAWLTS